MALEIAIRYGARNKKTAFIVKLFQNNEENKDFRQKVSEYYKHVSLVKPKASRPKSSEVYLVARNRSYNA